jgi:hypothetical protein
MAPSAADLGLDLEPFDGKLTFTAPGPRTRPEPLVSLLSARQASSARWSDADTAGVFLRQVVDTAQNWRDNAQAALPSYRDRMCRIRLLPAEGGLNLNMRQATIETLIARGGEAGAEINRRFTETEWHRHVAGRYLLLMRLLQQGLAAATAPYEAIRPLLRDGLPHEPPYGPGFARRAERATGRLLRAPSGWGRPPGAVDFEAGPEPRPGAAMRIGPL